MEFEYSGAHDRADWPPRHRPAPDRATQVPELGEWDGPVHGALGVLAVECDGSRVQCHACGRWFKALAHHTRPAHLLTPHEYRAIFGLNAGTALDAPALRDVKRRNSAPVLERYRPLNRQRLLAMTIEERRANASGPRRLQTRVDPHNREVWARLQAAGVARSRALWRDPDHAEPRAKRASETRGGRVAVPCAVCGARLELSRSELRSSRRHACGSDACRRELRRRLLAEREYLGSSHVRARAGETRRRTLAARPEYGRNVGARISQAKRRRDGSVIERLRALPTIAWESIPEPDRSIVRRYQGLDGQRPATMLELMAAYRLDHRVVRRLLTHGIARLLEPGSMPPAATSQDEQARRRAAMVARLRALPEGALAGLASLDREVIARFYGLDGEPPRRQRELARDLSVTRRRVHNALAFAASLVETDQPTGRRLEPWAPRHTFEPPPRELS